MEQIAFEIQKTMVFIPDLKSEKLTLVTIDEAKVITLIK